MRHTRSTISLVVRVISQSKNNFYDVIRLKIIESRYFLKETVKVGLEKSKQSGGQLKTTQDIASNTPKNVSGTRKKKTCDYRDSQKSVGMKNNYTFRIPRESLLTKSNCFNLFLRWFQFRILRFHLHFREFFHNLFLEQGHYRSAFSIISVIFFLHKQPGYDGNLRILLTGMAYGNVLVPAFALHLYASHILGMDPI